MNFKPQWLVRNPELRVGRGEYKLPLDGIYPAVDPVSNDKVLSDTNTSTKVEKKPVVSKTQSEIYVISSLQGDIVPQKDNGNFVSFGNPDVRSIVKSKRFYPYSLLVFLVTVRLFLLFSAESKREMIR